MVYENLKKYLSIILDMEKNIYIQEETLEYMYNERDSLGIRRNIEVPHCDKSSTDYSEWMYSTGSVLGVIGFLVALFAMWSRCWNVFGLFTIFIAPFFSFIIALAVGFVSAIVIGPFVAIGISKKEQSEYDIYYERRLQEYNHQKNNDDNRVKNEMLLRGKIQKDIALLESQKKRNKKAPQ